MFSVNFGEFWYFLNIIFSFAPEKSGHFNIMKKTKIIIFWFWEATARKKLWFSCIFDEKVTKKQHTRSANSLFLFFPHFFYNGPAVGFLWKRSKKEEKNNLFTTFAKIIIFWLFSWVVHYIFTKNAKIDPLLLSELPENDSIDQS